MMSKSKEVREDLSVVRDLAVGGHFDVRGPSHLHGNLNVDGWLEAKNIKNAAKGLFASVSKLTQRYPEPEDGWWAYVGDGFEATVYYVDEGSWVSTGKKVGPPMVDYEEYNIRLDKLSSSMSACEEKMREVVDDCKTLKKDICENYVGRFTSISREVPSSIRNVESAPAVGTILFIPVFGGIFVNYYDKKFWGIWEGSENLGSPASANQGIIPDKNRLYIDASGKLYLYEEDGELHQIANEEVSEAIKEINAIKRSKGVPEGVAPLNADGKISDSFLPDYRNLVSFAGRIRSVIVEKSSYSGAYSDALHVYYDIVNNKFVLFDCEEQKWYGTWNGSIKYGTVSPEGVIPSLNKIYLALNEDCGYYWDEDRLRPLCGEASERDVVRVMWHLLGPDSALPGLSADASCDCEEATSEEIKSAADSVFSN